MNVDQVRKGLFIDDDHESELFERGYIRLPFFTAEEMSELQRFYQNVHPEERIDLQGAMHGIHMTTWSGNTGYKRMVAGFIRNVFDRAISRTFKNHRHLNHVFIAKEGGDSTEFNIHQDWSVVDEAKDYSVNIWTPLHDVNSENGALWILPGSHRLDQPIRGAGCLFPDYISEMGALRPKVKCIEVQAGEALIFFHATIHGSPPNRSSQKRVVACCTVVHEQAKIRTYFQPDAQSKLHVYEPEDDFMYDYRDIMNEAAKRPPNGRLVETREPYSLNRIELKTLLELAEAHSSSELPSA